MPNDQKHRKSGYHLLEIHELCLWKYCGGIQKVCLSWREEGFLKKQTKTNRKSGVKPICILSLWKKITWFFIQETDFFLISCLAVAKSFAVLSLVQYIKLFLYFQMKIHKRNRTFFERGGINSLKGMYIELKQGWGG